MLESNIAAIHLAPGERVSVSNPLGGSLTFMLRGAQTNGTLIAFETPVAGTRAQGGRLLAILSPSGLEAFFERFAEPADGASAAERFRALGGEAGVRVAGPPLSQSHPHRNA